jgi:hypothetical protein
MFDKKPAQDYTNVNLDDFSDDSSDDDEDFVQKSIRNQQVRTVQDVGEMRGTNCRVFYLYIGNYKYK